MGWNKISVGNRHDSLSDHVLMIECLSKHIIAGIVSSKVYRICPMVEENGEELSKHVYPKNYEDSSKSIEADAALHLYKIVYDGSNKNTYMRAILADNDSSMRSLRKGKIQRIQRKLPPDMPVLDWLVDPSHRTEVVAK